MWGGRGINPKQTQTSFSPKLRAEQNTLSLNGEEYCVWFLKVFQPLFPAFFFQHTCFLLGNCKRTIIIMQLFSLLGTNSSVAAAIASLWMLDPTDPWAWTELRWKVVALWSVLNPTKHRYDHLGLALGRGVLITWVGVYLSTPVI